MFPLLMLIKEWRTKEGDVGWFILANVLVFLHSVFYMTLSLIKVWGVKVLVYLKTTDFPCLSYDFLEITRISMKNYWIQMIKRKNGL